MGGDVQQNLLQKAGVLFVDVVGRNLSTEFTEMEIEFNVAVVRKNYIVK